MYWITKLLDLKTRRGWNDSELAQEGVVVLFVQIGALSPEAQHPCGFPRVATPAS